MAGSEDRTIPDLPKANKDNSLMPGQESFNTAFNPPNNPKKDQQPSSSEYWPDPDDYKVHRDTF